MKFKHTYRRAADCVSAPEELTNTVLQIPKQTKPRAIPRPLRLVAVAAVLALVIGILSFWPAGEQEYVTGPGLLAIRAYALNENEISEINSTVLEEGVELPWEYAWSPAINVVSAGLPIKLEFPEEEFEGAKISLEVTVSGGSVFGDPVRLQDPSTGKYYWSDNPYLGDTFTVENNSTLYWQFFSTKFHVLKNEYTHGSPFAHGKSYLDIVIRADDYIVGYAVVEIYELPEEEAPAFRYKARVLNIASFPKVEGMYQAVSRKYVEKKFEEIHQK